MSQPFDAGQGLIVVPAELFGPSGSVVLHLAVDTGATQTMSNVGLLAFAGYDPSLVPDRVQVTTEHERSWADCLEKLRELCAA